MWLWYCKMSLKLLLLLLIMSLVEGGPTKKPAKVAAKAGAKGDAKGGAKGADKVAAKGGAKGGAKGADKVAAKGGSKGDAKGGAKGGAKEVAKKTGKVVEYDGNEVLRLSPKTPEQLKALKDVANKYDFWSPPRSGAPTDVRVNAKNKAALVKILTDNKIEYKTLIDNVQTQIVNERKSKVKKKSGGKLDWTEFYSHDEMLSHLKKIALKNKDICQVMSAGKTTEKRDLTVFRIGKAAKKGVKKKGFWLDGGIHAREWISPAISTWIVNELLVNRTKYKDLFENLDMYILPQINADGYEFSRTVDRMWRKTRSIVKGKHNPQNCYGVDPNRNFGYMYGGEGTSDDPCDETYRGQKAFSEPETKLMSNFILNKRKIANWRMYLSLHAYSEMVLIPWGYSADLVPDFADLYTVGMKARAAIEETSEHRYEVGSSTLLLGATAGGSDDWAKGMGIFKYAYTIETRDTSEFGFILPKEQIIPAAEEVWAGILAMATFLAEEQI